MTNIYAPTDHDGTSAEELELYHLIMDYRASLGLDPIQLSNALSITAGRHVLDTRDNIWGANLNLPSNANLHSWSDAFYYSDHSAAANMWDAPERLGTGYTSSGFEISAAGYGSIEAALAGWQSSSGHNAVIANTGIWANYDWNAIGIGVETSYDGSLNYGGRVYHVWFGRATDTSGGPVISGTVGNDDMTGTDFDDHIEGSAGNDIVAGGLGVDLADYSGLGASVEIYMNAGVVYSSAGDDSISGIENLIGTAQNDRLNGTSEDNDIQGGHGDDIIKGKGGTDTLSGGAGNDVIRGGDGDDTIHGGFGSDILIALAGNDTLSGGGNGDFLYGGRDSDVLRGDGGNDVLRGNLGNDDMDGGAAADDLRGGGGNDMLTGGDGDDFIMGQSGSDTIAGGAGNDVLTGGSGMGSQDGTRDTFVFGSGDGTDKIKDFENGIDVIDLSGFGFTNFSTQIAPLAEDRSNGLRIDFGGGDVLFIDGFTAGQFNAGDVILA